MNTRRLIEALWFLQSRSLANAIRVRLRRLRQPRYLVGAVVGLGYLYFWFGHGVMGGPDPSRTAPDLESSGRAFLQGIAALVLLGVLFAHWVFPGNRAALQFTETELAFLLPAPISRQLLVRYKLLSSQMGTLLSAGILTLLTGRFATDGTVIFRVLGWWIILTVLNLHAIGASFSIQRLTERGLSSWMRRTAALSVASLVVGLTVFWIRSTPAMPSFAGTPEAVTAELGDWFQVALQSGPGHWMLTPARWVVQPWFARTGGEFLLSLGPVLMLLLLLIYWVERSDVSFEEASMALAEQRALAVTRVRERSQWGTAPPTKATPPPFPLAPLGPAPVALVWKNLIAAKVTPRRLVAALSAAAVALMVLSLWEHPVLRATTGTASLLAFAALTLVSGSQCSRSLRNDMTMMDVLRGYPIPGWQIVLGELMGPALVLYFFQSLCVATGLIAATAEPAILEFPRITLIAAGIAALLIAGPLNLVNALTPTAATLLFPAWSRPGRDIQQPGFEALGQRILFGLGQLLAMIASLIPAALVGAGAYLAAQWLIGVSAALVIAGLASGALLSLEAYLGIRLLGGLLDRYDASSET